MFFTTLLQAVAILSDLTSDLDCLSQSGDSPLHVMILRHRVDCAVALLVHGASAEATDKDGNNALHLAVKVSKSLSVFCAVFFWYAPPPPLLLVIHSK